MKEELFNEDEMDFIFNLMGTKSTTLKQFEDYATAENSLQEAKDIISNYSLEIQDIFYKALDSTSITADYQICLAYYLGIQKGFEIKKL